ncbi:MAG: YjbQ family protein [Spirochaetales bacterium]|nr:YjbQ family protein [Spirochaetales bacterium]
MVYGQEISLQTKGFSDIRDITGDVNSIIGKSEITDGLVVISVIGSTASISTIEYEPALVGDVQDQLEKMVPHEMHSRHSLTWGDDNGFSHIRATLMGPGITLPVSGGRVVLGTWQQIIVIDHDNRPRDRRVFIQVMGEKK